MPSKPHCLIIGGGIAGPALALFLKKAGFTAAVYEAYPHRGEIGGALGLAPNGMNVLNELGLAEPVIEAGTICSAMAFRTQAGKTIGVMPYGPRGRYAQPAVTLSRAKLHEIMVEAARREAIPIEYGKRLRHTATDDRGVTAYFADGTEARGDLLVGADGISSRVREIIMPTGPRPEFTGIVGTGGFVRRSAIPVGRPEDRQTMVFYFGSGAFFGYAFGDRDDENGAFWWTALERERPLSDGDRSRITLDDVRTSLGAAGGESWDDAVMRIIDATTAFIPPLNLFDVSSLPRWSAGRIVLVGDAAHAMSPHSGQGASVALEDAISLAKHLRERPHAISEAFAAFEAERRGRAERIVAYGRRSGDTKKARGPVAAWLQRLLMPVFIRLAGFSSGWIYGHRIKWQD